MGIYFDLAETLKPEPKKTFRGSQHKVFLYHAQEMHTQFPEISLKMCLKTIIENYKARVKFRNEKNCDQREKDHLRGKNK